MRERNAIALPGLLVVAAIVAMFGPGGLPAGHGPRGR